jgi:hypothetical protein
MLFISSYIYPNVLTERDVGEDTMEHILNYLKKLEAHWVTLHKNVCRALPNDPPNLILGFQIGNKIIQF